MNQEIQAVPVSAQTQPRRSDSSAADSKPFWSPKREKPSKCLLFMLILIVFAAAALLILALIFLPAKTPAVKIRSVTVTALRYDGNASSPSFNTSLQTQLSIKNANFGQFQYENGTGRFYYMDSVVGEMNIPSGGVGPRKRKHIDVRVTLTSSGVAEKSELSEGLGSGLLEVRSRLRMSGRIYLLDGKVKRIRNPEMNCLIALNLTATTVKEFSCD